MRRSGHTLLEMMLSLTLLSIIAVSVGSAVMLASQATPEEGSPTATLLSDSKVLARIAEDLSLAMYIPERSANTVTIVVADRTGDGLPDRITYAWSGTPGMPLTFELNDQSPVALIQQVDQFELDFTIATQTKAIPAPNSTAGTEVLLSESSDTSDSNQYDIQYDKWYAQGITPTLSADASGFQVTRIELYAASKSTTDGVSLIEIWNDNSSAPGTTRYAHGTMIESDLVEGKFSWSSIDMSDALTVSSGATVYLTIKDDSGSDEVGVISSTGSGPGGMLKSAGDSDWQSESGQTIHYRLYGKEVQASPGYDLTREYVTSVGISLRSTADGRSSLTRKVSLEQAPEVLTNFWHAGFDASPTSYDLDGDASEDWVYGSGGSIPVGNLSDSAWSATDTLQAKPTGTLPDVVRVEVRAQATNGDVAMIYGPMHNDGSGNVLPMIAVLMEDGSDQQLEIYNEQTPTTPIATITGLDDKPLDIKITLLPSEQLLYVMIDGVEKGSAVLAWEADQGLRGFYLDGSGSGALFQDVRLTYGGSYVENASAPVVSLTGTVDAGGGDSGASVNWWESLFK